MHGSLVQQSEDCELDGFATTCHATYRSDISEESGTRVWSGSAGGHVAVVFGPVAPARTLYRAPRAEPPPAGGGARRGDAPRTTPCPRPRSTSTLSGKRRAPGPAVKRTPAATSKSSGRGAYPGRAARRSGASVAGSSPLASSSPSSAWAPSSTSTRRPSCPTPTPTSRPRRRSIYYSDGKTEVGKFATQNREIITLDEMPQTLQDAVVAAENQTFWTDKGIDPKGILRAAFSNAQGNATQGASTITQQYVKILYLTQEQTLTRKLKEAILSLKLQNQVSKKEILEGYLNTIYFGRGAYGVQAAAHAYFDKDAQDLDLRESAFLADRAEQPHRLRPRRQGEPRGHPRALPLRARLDGEDRGDHRRGGGDGQEAPAEVPRDRAGEHLRWPAWPHAAPRQGRAPPARVHRRADRRRWPAGDHDVHAEGDEGSGGGRQEGPPRRLLRTRSCTSRLPRSSPAPVRCAASTAARTS